MTDLKHSQRMPDTGERREITHFVNAKEAEEVLRIEELGFENETAIRKDRARKPFSQAT
jgi:hypothetical protein